MTSFTCCKHNRVVFEMVRVSTCTYVSARSFCYLYKPVSNGHRNSYTILSFQHIIMISSFPSSNSLYQLSPTKQ